MTSHSGKCQWDLEISLSDEILVTDPAIEFHVPPAGSHSLFLYQLLGLKNSRNMSENCGKYERIREYMFPYTSAVGLGRTPGLPEGWGGYHEKRHETRQI